MNAVQNVRPRGLQVVPVKIDLEGMLPTGPGGLEDVLKNWDASKGKRPHLMYTVTYVKPQYRTICSTAKLEIGSGRTPRAERFQSKEGKTYMLYAASTMSSSSKMIHIGIFNSPPRLEMKQPLVGFLPHLLHPFTHSRNHPASLSSTRSFPHISMLIQRGAWSDSIPSQRP